MSIIDNNNMNLNLLIAILLASLCLYIWIGKRAAGKSRTQDDYFLMGRSLTFLPLCLTLLATQLGGGILLGAAGEAYDKGWSAIFYPCGASLGLLALGFGFGTKLRQLNINTIPEIFLVIYKSDAQRLIAAIISIISLQIIFISQGIAAKKFLLVCGIQ